MKKFSRLPVGRTGEIHDCRYGSELTQAEQRYLLSTYIYRYTRENKPHWASGPRPDGSAYPVQFASDSDWLANTYFAVTQSGALDMRIAGCYSRPTWPDNPELRAPNGIGFINS